MVGRGQRPNPRYGSGAYLRWISQKARQEKVLSELFAKFAEEDRQLRLERERKGKEKGNYEQKRQTRGGAQEQSEGCPRNRTKQALGARRCEQD